MNRAQRRAKEKLARRMTKQGMLINQGKPVSDDPGIDAAQEYTWHSYKSPPEPKPEFKQYGINCPPEFPEFTHKVRHNVWHDRSEFDLFVNTIKELSDDTEGNHWSWSRNWNCKYLNLRIDMRDGGFCLMNDKNKRINVEQLKWQYDWDREKESTKI